MSDSGAAQIAADYLESNAGSLVENWIDWVRERVSTETIAALPERALRNHIPPVLVSLSKYLREPVQLARNDLAANLRLHGEIRRDQGYSMAEVLAEFDGLADVVTRAVIRSLADTEAPADELLWVTNRLAAGLRSISYIAMGTFAESDDKRNHQISHNLELLARAISHEMRTPLNSISLGVELLRDKGVDEALESQVEIMANAVKRCRNLLETLQILSIAENARGGSHMVEIGDAIRAVVKEFEQTAQESSVDVSVDDSVPQLRVEALLMYVVLANVLSNSIKYTDPEKTSSRVEIGVEYLEEKHDSGFCKVTVRDNGLGIPEEFVARVFQQGFRAHASTADGTGVGLYLVQQSVMARGGNVTLESTEGEGTTVTITVRCLQADGDALSADEFSVQTLMGEVIRSELENKPKLPDEN